jgi:hypothetical protein
MFLWGSFNKLLKLAYMEVMQCLPCKQARTFSLLVSYRVHHIWYLFRWPTRKTYRVTCQSCGTTTAISNEAAEAKLGRCGIPVFDRFGWAIAIMLAVALIAYIQIAKANAEKKAGSIEGVYPVRQ